MVISPQKIKLQGWLVDGKVAAMERPLRIDYPSAIHHVTGRMVGRWQGGRERLFRDERDYRRFFAGGSALNGAQLVIDHSPAIGCVF